MKTARPAPTAALKTAIKASAAILLSLALPPLCAEEAGESPYALAADAATGFVLASPAFDALDPGTAALWTLSANFLHRFEGRGWGAVLNHAVDLSGSSVQPGTTPAFAGSVHEAYVRVDLGPSASLAIGKRRMQLGLGTTFAPGDMVNPRTAFWDQKDGFRGLSFAGSVGADLSLRAAISLDANLEAFSKALAARQALAAYNPADPRILAAKAAAATALDGASGPADPSLLLWAGSADLQAGALEVALAASFRPDRLVRPSLGLSVDLSGLILQAEGAVELAEGFDGADWYGTAGARYTIYGDSAELGVSLDGEYGGGRGLSGKLYLLPSLSLSVTDYGSAFARALVDLDGASALLSAGLTWSRLEDMELEFSGAFGLGDEGSEFSRLPSPMDGMRAALGLAARIHF